MQQFFVRGKQRPTKDSLWQYTNQQRENTGLASFKPYGFLSDQSTIVYLLINVVVVCEKVQFFNSNGLLMLDFFFRKFYRLWIKYMIANYYCISVVLPAQ